MTFWRSIFAFKHWYLLFVRGTFDVTSSTPSFSSVWYLQHKGIVMIFTNGTIDSDINSIAKREIFFIISTSMNERLRHVWNTKLRYSGYHFSLYTFWGFCHSLETWRRSREHETKASQLICKFHYEWHLNHDK